MCVYIDIHIYTYYDNIDDNNSSSSSNSCSSSSSSNGSSNMIDRSATSCPWPTKRCRQPARRLAHHQQRRGEGEDRGQNTWGFLGAPYLGAPSL